MHHKNRNIMSTSIGIGILVIACFIIVLICNLIEDYHWRCPNCGYPTEEKEDGNGNIVRICKHCGQYYYIDTEFNDLKNKIESNDKEIQG